MRPFTLLICFLSVSVLLGIWIRILRSWKRAPKLRLALARLTVLVATCVYLFIILEFLFFSVFTFSDGFGVTLSAQRWAEKYWHPINSLGYRDVEHTSTDLQNKQVIFVVGDSLAAGHGIERIEDRFSNLLEHNLGQQYVVVNIARGGWDTAYEYNAITSYPVNPKRIVLEYFVNDIDGVARKAGLLPPLLIEPPENALLAYVVNHSYFINFIYWRVYRLRYQDMGIEYWQAIKNSYSNPDVWTAHAADLDRIVRFTQERGIGLTVVIFPNLAAIKDSAPITSKTGQFFTSRNVRVIDLEPLLESRDPASLVVNSADSHPNRALHREVADLLTREARDQGW